ncbi:hypothetical protein BaRGS_00013102, partial [Batillaria attramentaria]
ERVLQQDIKLQRQEQEIQDRKETILNLDSELQQLKTKQHASDGPGFTGQHVPDKEIQKRSDDTSAWEPVVSQMSSQMTQMNAEIQVLKTVNQQQDQRISQSIGELNVHSAMWWIYLHPVHFIYDHDISLQFNQQ